MMFINSEAQKMKPSNSEGLQKKTYCVKYENNNSKR